jgi:hypothetical protein
MRSLLQLPGYEELRVAEALEGDRATCGVLDCVVAGGLPQLDCDCFVAVGDGVHFVSLSLCLLMSISVQH